MITIRQTCQSCHERQGRSDSAAFDCDRITPINGKVHVVLDEQSSRLLRCEARTAMLLLNGIDTTSDERSSTCVQLHRHQSTYLHT